MDKKNTILGTILFIAAFGVLMYSQKFAPQRPAPSEIRKEVAKQTGTSPQAVPATAGSTTSWSG